MCVHAEWSLPNIFIRSSNTRRQNHAVIAGVCCSINGTHVNEMAVAILHRPHQCGRPLLVLRQACVTHHLGLDIGFRSSEKRFLGEITRVAACRSTKRAERRRKDGLQITCPANNPVGIIGIDVTILIAHVKIPNRSTTALFPGAHHSSTLPSSKPGFCFSTKRECA